MFELRTEPFPALASLSATGAVELRELDFGRMFEAIVAAPDAVQTGLYQLAASLHVDGEPIGIDRLRALPGRYFVAIQLAQAACRRLHSVEDEGESAALMDEAAKAGKVDRPAAAPG